MVQRSQIEVFWKSWGPGSPDDKEEFEKLRNRVCTVIKNDIWPQVWSLTSFLEEFVLLTGASYRLQEGSTKFWESSLYLHICSAETLLDFMQAVQSMLWALHKTSPKVRDVAVEGLNRVFELSPNVIAHISASAEGPLLYPGGAKILDDALIADNLQWLDQHPSALKNFREALSILLSKDANKYRNLLDDLRFAVEQLLRDVLGNKKSLENQKDALLPWMKVKGLHANVIGMYHDLLFKHFAIYQNDAVKHGEKYAQQEIEFMIYLTGTFMRLLIQASRQEIPEAR